MTSEKHGAFLLNKPSSLDYGSVINRLNNVLGNEDISHPHPIDTGTSGLVIVGVGNGGWLIQNGSQLTQTYKITLVLDIGVKNTDLLNAFDVMLANLFFKNSPRIHSLYCHDEDEYLKECTFFIEVDNFDAIEESIKTLNKLIKRNGIIKRIERVKIGNFDLQNKKTTTIDELEELSELIEDSLVTFLAKRRLNYLLYPPVKLASQFPSIKVSQDLARDIFNGEPIKTSDFRDKKKVLKYDPFECNDVLCIYDSENNLVSACRANDSHTKCNKKDCEEVILSHYKSFEV